MTILNILYIRYVNQYRESRNPYTHILQENFSSVDIVKETIVSSYAMHEITPITGIN